MPNPTPQQIEDFKAAFKLSAEAINAKISWDSGWFKQQTALASVVTALEAYDENNALETISQVSAAIEALPDKAKTKYKTALDALRLKITGAIASAQMPVATVPLPTNNDLDQDDVIDDPTANVDPEPVDQEPEDQEVEPDPPSPGQYALQNAMDAVANTYSLFEYNDEFYTKFDEVQDAADAIEAQELATAHNTNQEPDDITDRMVQFAIKIGKGRTRFWKDEEFWTKWLKHTRYDIVFDEDTSAAEAALNTAQFDSSVQADTPVVDQLLATFAQQWKKDENTVVSDSKMDISFKKNIGKPGDVWYWPGQIPGVTNDESASNVSVLDFSDNDKVMVKTAKDTVAKIKKKLTKGAFNNTAGLSAEVKLQQHVPQDMIAHHNAQEFAGVAAPAWWNNVVESAIGIAAKKYKSSDQPDVNDGKLNLACMARATLEVGGGVCSKMAACSVGELTTTLPPGSEIVQLHGRSFDHEFVIARVPGGKWFVVDPWPHDPTVLPFVDCQFKPDGVTSFIMTKVKETADHPFGINLDTLDWNSIIDEAMKATPVDTLEMQGVYGHQKNANEGNFDPALKAANSYG